MVVLLCVNLEYFFSFDMEGIRSTFARCKAEKRPALVTYVTAGYPTPDETVDVLLGMEAGGAGLIPPLCALLSLLTDC